eukprot:248744_1
MSSLDVLVFISLISYVSSECAYFREAGARRPTNRCIMDGINMDSVIYECATDGSTVTAKAFNASSNCDETTFFSETVYTSTTTDASFVCSNNHSCDLCWKVFSGQKSDCSDIDFTASNFYMNCYYNGFCNELKAIPRKDGGESLRSSKYVCSSNTTWEETTYSENTDSCEPRGEGSWSSTKPFNTWCHNVVGGGVQYKIVSIPMNCTNIASGHFKYAFYIALCVQFITFWFN